MTSFFLDDDVLDDPENPDDPHDPDEDDEDDDHGDDDDDEETGDPDVETWQVGRAQRP
jgi:hypothetical protein